MSLEQLSSLAQIVGSVGVIVSLIFVGLQIKHNTGALRGNPWRNPGSKLSAIVTAIAI